MTPSTDSDGCLRPIRYELVQSGKLKGSQSQLLPDVYSQ